MFSPNRIFPVESFFSTLTYMYLRNSKWSQTTDDLYIFIKTSEMSVQTIRIKTLFNTSVRSHIFFLHSYDVALNSGPL